MYQFNGKIKLFALVLIVLGLVGTTYSFLSAPKSIEEVKEILAKQEDHGHHGGHAEDAHSDGAHEESHAKDDHKTEAHNEAAHVDKEHSKETVAEKVIKDLGEHAEETVAEHAKHAEDHIAHESKEEHATHVKDTVHANETVAEHVLHALGSHGEETIAQHSKHHDEVHSKVANAASENGEAHHADDHHSEEHHLEHVKHQMQNRPWSALYVAMLFFLGISLLVMAFYAAQRVAHSGWSVVLFRVMEAITNNIHYVSIFMFIFIILTVMHQNHLFPWMAEGTFDPLSDHYDPIVDGKKWWMNVPGWAIRSIIYLAGWNAFRFIIRKKSKQQDNGDLALHKNIYNICVGFIVFFMITESMASWDWIMGIDPHWFSTLFGWYVLATFLVSALTIIAFVTIYLRSKGHLPLVNDSHIHDLAKFMFGFSVFWTYLWFAQFMLIWYADMPEETTYYLQRFNEYKVPFFAMVAMNFVFPVLVLLNSDFKSMPWFVVIAGVVILAGHYIDLFVMIMPGTVGAQWGFGIGEISAFLFFLGLFIYATFSAFANADPVAKGSPFLHESETFHYYVIEHRGEDSHGHH